MNTNKLEGFVAYLYDLPDKHKPSSSYRTGETPDVVMDAYSRKIISWSMKRTADSHLAQDALKMALDRRHLQD